MNLSETIDLMTSADYKERFVGEYLQLRIRQSKLFKTIERYYCGGLEFEPQTPIATLSKQLDVMQEYIEILEERAECEGIDLTDEITSRFMDSNSINITETTKGMAFMYRIKDDESALHFGLIVSNTNGIIYFKDFDTGESTFWDEDKHLFRGLC